MTKENARVFIVDDDPSSRKSLTRLLKSVGLDSETFADGREFLKLNPYKGPACLVLDIKMPGLSGLELQELIRSKDNAIPIIFITGHGDIPMTVKAIKKGAIDFLSKPFDEKDLLKAVHEALKKDTANKRTQKQLKTNLQRLKSLTTREYEVLIHVISGILNKQIGHALEISEAAVKVHRGRVMEKMNVASVAELVRLCEKLDVKPAKTKS